MHRVARFAAVVATLTLPSIAASAEVEEGEECYDAIVSAMIVKQTPTAIPDCGPDCLVMRWPWFVDLKVGHVVEGEISGRSLTVLTFQHTSIRSDLGYRKWALRRNSLGSFNVVNLDHTLGSRWDDKPAPCASDAAPAEPYIDPGPNRTLAELRSEAERQSEAEH